MVLFLVFPPPVTVCPLTILPKYGERGKESWKQRGYYGSNLMTKNIQVHILREPGLVGAYFYVTVKMLNNQDGLAYKDAGLGSNIACVSLDPPHPLQSLIWKSP